MRLFDFFQKKSETKKIDLSQISIDSSEDMANSKPIAESSHQNECHNAAPEPPNVHSDSENPDKKLERLSIFKSDIIKLVGYSGEDTQYTIGYMKKNSPVSIKKTYGKNGVSFDVVNDYGENIGRLPSKFTELCQSNKVVFAVFDDAVFGSTSYQPSIKVFWDIPADGNSPKVELYDAKLNQISFYKKLVSYVVLDVETTGLNSVNDKIIEIGMARIRNGNISETYSTLVNPDMPIQSDASAVNGIYDDDVRDAPQIHEIIHDINAFIGNDIVVGHNITFDLRFLRMAMLENGISKSIGYVNTLSVSRSILPHLKDHKLQTLMEAAGIKECQIHRALDDAINTHKILQYCIKEKIKQNDAMQEERKAQKQAADAERSEKYSDSPLYNKHFVFTGIFVNDRDELEGMVPRVGALLRSGVTKKTDYLVKGDMSDSANWTGIKLSKAEEAIKNGGSVQIIGEQEFLELIKNAKSVLS